jgi:hypothetical protein
MFNWTLALTPTEMHRGHLQILDRLPSPSFSGPWTRRSIWGQTDYSRFCVTGKRGGGGGEITHTKKKEKNNNKKHENSNAGLRDLSYSLHNRSVNHAALLSAGPCRWAPARLGGETPISIISQTRTDDGWAKFVHSWAQARQSQACRPKGHRWAGWSQGSPCPVRRQDRFGSSTAIAPLLITNESVCPCRRVQACKLTGTPCQQTTCSPDSHSFLFFTSSPFLCAQRQAFL